MSGRVAWKFYDPETLEEIGLEVNPYEDAGSHTLAHRQAYAQAEVAPYRSPFGEDKLGTLVLSPGYEQERFKYNGRVYTEAQYAIMENWCNRRYPIHMTDDLGRTFRVLIDEWLPARVRSRQSRYKHTYTFGGIILEEIFT